MSCAQNGDLSGKSFSENCEVFAVSFYPEDGDILLFLNVRTFIPYYTASHLKLLAPEFDI
jgi:hypothetical protein